MKKLTKEQHEILVKKGTEAPFTGKYLHNKQKGEYVCAQCGNVLFSSKHKFDSGTGWPSFYGIAKSGQGSVKLKKDFSHGMFRTEIVCSKCGGHLGHLFNEVKTKACPTGKRYCINSLALGFKKKKK